MNAHEPASLPRKRGRSLAQDVMEDLAAKIRNGRYKPGEKLPTETEIMAEQGVSRTVVREAMSRLQAAGLAETRHGIGTFALAPAPSSSLKLDVGTVVTIRDILAMLELRISLETEAAGLAAVRRTDEHLAAMRRALDAFEENIESGGSAVDADFQFHLQIALATHNRYFEEILRNLGRTTIPRTRVDTARLAADAAGQTYLHRTNREHEDIYEAIARQDPEAARAAMRMHLTNSRERLRRAEEAAGSGPAG